MVMPMPVTIILLPMSYIPIWTFLHIYYIVLEQRQTHAEEIHTWCQSDLTTYRLQLRSVRYVQSEISNYMSDEITYICATSKHRIEVHPKKDYNLIIEDYFMFIFSICIVYLFIN